jgi:hydrogenase maturation protease
MGPGTAHFIDGGTMSFSLLPYVEMADSMLIADAANLDQAPGTILLLEGSAMDAFLKTTRRRSVHEVGLIDLLDMARLHGCLPRQRALLCIQPQTIDWGETLSTGVAAALPAALTQARTALQRWKDL